MELSSRLFFVFAFILLVTSPTVNGEDVSVVVSLEVSQSLVEVGQRVVFTCTITGIASDRLVNFNKLVMADSDFTNILKEPITVVTSKEIPYSKLQRYSVEKSTDGPAIVYRLIISGAQYEDNGGYSCSVRDADTYAVVVLEVYRPPNSVHFINRNESELIVVAEGELISDLTCEAARLAPLADFTIFIGNRSITDDFLISSKTNVLCPEIGNIAKTCPLHADFNMIAQSREFRPIYTDNNKTLTCTVTTRSFDHKNISTSVKLNVTHGPKISCLDTLIVPLNATTAKLNCTIFANPLHNLSVSWVINQLGNRITVNSSSQAGEYSVKETFFPDDPTKVVTTLLINRKTPITSIKSVNMDAENHISRASGEIAIKKQSAPPGNDGIVAVQLPSVSLFFSSALVYVASLMMSSRRG